MGGTEGFLAEEKKEEKREKNGGANTQAVDKP